MKRAVIYARVSTDRQAEEGLSVESQIEACRRKAEELGAAVLHVYTDEGISGTTDARPGFRAAINHCTLAGADYMLVWSSSRFARDQHDAITYKRELQACGVRLVYASSGLDLGTNEGWLTDSFQQIIDEHYSRQVSMDTKRSMIRAAGAGFFMGGRVPYGYEAVPAADGKRRRLQPHPDEAPVVQAMFENSARGIGAFAIAVMLNEQGITHRGRPWNKNTVLNMLGSEVYMGEVIYNRFDRKRRRERPPGEWIRVPAHEPLVSRERFQEVQDGLARRAPGENTPTTNALHIFAGLLRCGHCDAGLKVSNGKGRNGTVYHYYGCNARLQGRRCSFKPVRADRLDAWLLGELLDRVLTRENVQGVLEQLDKAANDWVKQRGARRRSLVAELRKAETARSNLFSVLETHGKGAPGVNEMGPRLRELNEQIRRLEASLVALEDEQPPVVDQLGVDPAAAADVMRAMVTTCENPRAVRDFIASIVERVVVERQAVRVDYHPECLIRHEGAVVHSTRNWLPVLAKLRTTSLVLEAPAGLLRAA